MKIGEKYGKYTITGIRHITGHGKLFPNKNIVMKIALLGNRGAKVTAFVKRDGKVGKLFRNFDYFIGEFYYDYSNDTCKITEVA